MLNNYVDKVFLINLPHRRNNTVTIIPIHNMYKNTKKIIL
jgi:hypothetical protein